MESDQAKADFRKSSVLYEMGRYQESMQLLSSLDRAFPNNPDVLYPLARCMAKQGWDEDALEICSRLETPCKHPKARRLKKKIVRAQNSAPTESRATANIVELDDIPDFSRPKWMYVIPVGVLIILALLGFSLMGNQKSSTESWERPTIRINKSPEE